MVLQREIFKLLLPLLGELFDEFLHLHGHIFKSSLLQK